MPARRFETSVAGAVGFEGVSDVVGRSAVQLHDQALPRPCAVHLLVFDSDVGLGQWKTGIEKEGLEAL